MLHDWIDGMQKWPVEVIQFIKRLENKIENLEKVNKELKDELFGRCF